jgi:hypothetical protein
MTDEQQQDEAPEVGLWRYTSRVPRFYGNPVVTAREGTVIEHTGPPAEDGCWEPVDALGDGETVQQPDNAPPSGELDAYGHYVVDGRSIAGPASWDHDAAAAPDDAAPAPAESADGADGGQQEMMIDDHDDEYAGPTGERQ